MVDEVKIFGSGGAKNVPGIKQYTIEAILYAMAFGDGALLRVRYDKHYPDSIVVGDSQDLSLTELLKLFQLTGKIPLLYVDEKAPNQETCVDKIAAIIAGYGGAILTPMPSIAKRAVCQVNPTHVLVGLLAGNLLENGIDPMEEAAEIDGLDALVLYGYEFTPERTKDIHGAFFYPIYNIKDDLNPELINAIAKSGAWIICDDPGSVAKLIRPL